MLIYDCRLMNSATRSGQALCLRDLFMDSDRRRDPHGWVMDLEATYDTARLILNPSPEGSTTPGQTDYLRTRAVAQYACARLRNGVQDGILCLSPQEEDWLERIVKTVESLPDSPESLRARIEANYPGVFLPEEYGLEK